MENTKKWSLEITAVYCDNDIVIVNFLTYRFHIYLYGKHNCKVSQLIEIIEVKEIACSVKLSV